MNILMLLSNPINVDTRVELERDALVNAGHEVDIVCRNKANDYHTTEIDAEGLVFYTRETKLIKSLDKLSAMLSIPLFNLEMYKRAVEWHKAFHYEVIHAHDFDTLCVAVAMKLRFGVKIVYDAHEIYNKMVSGDMPHIVCKVLEMLERYLIKKIDRMIVISKPYLNYYLGKTNAQIYKVTHFKPLKWQRYSNTNNDKFTLLYIGNNLSEKRYFPQIIDLTANMNIKLRIGGMMNKKHEEMIEYVKEKNYSHVELLGQLKDGDEILKETRKADATFVFCDVSKSENYKYNLFNKQFEAMVAGRPFIVSGGTYAGEIVYKTNSGLVTPFEPDYIKGAIELLRDMEVIRKRLGKNALKAAKEKYNWEKESKNLLAVYKSLEGEKEI